MPRPSEREREERGEGRGERGEGRGERGEGRGERGEGRERRGLPPSSIRPPSEPNKYHLEFNSVRARKPSFTVGLPKSPTYTKQSRLWGTCINFVVLYCNFRSLAFLGLLGF